MVTPTDAMAAHGVLGHWSIPRELSRVPDARRHVRVLAEKVFGPTDRAHDVAVCASETIGNAVVHGLGDWICVVVCADQDGLTVEVCDAGSTRVPQQQSGTDESGRGLLIVSQLADRWNYTIEAETGQMCVSFEFDLTAASESGGTP